MSTNGFGISVNAHHPAVETVYDLKDGLFSINLGNATGGYSHVSLLVTLEEWRAIVRDVDQRLATMGIEKINGIDYSLVHDAVAGDWEMSEK